MIENPIIEGNSNNRYILSCVPSHIALFRIIQYINIVIANHSVVPISDDAE
jgi:hypothetical protein